MCAFEYDMEARHAKLIINLIHFAVPTTNYKIHERCSIFLTCMNVGPLGWVSRALNGGSMHGRTI